MDAMKAASELEALYEKVRREKRATAHHAPKLRALASQVDVAVEFGVRSGLSTVALLAGGPKVYSYDQTRWPQFEERYQALQRLAGDRWTFVEAGTLEVQIPACGLLFIDDLHEYEHVKAELALHADKVERYIAFHDTVSYGEIGMDPNMNRRGEFFTVQHGGRRGIMPAIEEFLGRGGWRVESHDMESAGLMVVERT